MRMFLSCSALLVLAAAVAAAPVTPGDQQSISNNDGEKELKVKPNDCVQVQITSPSRKKKGVFDLDVTADGDVIVAGAWSTVDPHLVTADGAIMIQAGLKPNADSGTIAYTYKDGEGKKHEGKVLIRVEKPKDNGK